MNSVVGMPPNLPQYTIVCRAPQQPASFSLQTARYSVSWDNRHFPGEVMDLKEIMQQQSFAVAGDTVRPHKYAAPQTRLDLYMQ